MASREDLSEYLEELIPAACRRLADRVREGVSVTVDLRLLDALLHDTQHTSEQLDRSAGER